MPGFIPTCLYFLAVLAAMVTAGGLNDLRVIQSSKGETVYELSIKNFRLQDALNEDGITWQKAAFDNAVFTAHGGYYSLPSRMLQFIIPENGDLTVEIISRSQRRLANINLKPADPQLKNVAIHAAASKLIETGPKMRFRDMMQRTVLLNPLTYDAASATLTVSDRIVFKVSWSGIPPAAKSYRKNGRLDDVYQSSFVNFEQAKNWQIKKSLNLTKANTLPAATFYSLQVEQDGIYKITASTLNNLGIDTEMLTIDALQMYNNGGHMLNFATSAQQYNPPYTQEIAISVFDLNNNNFFDNNDYLLFYGKSVNGWFYNAETGTFEHQTHYYDTQNTYYLSVDGRSGKRISYMPLGNVNVQASRAYFLERFHYERDLYNLLSSGPDWYGYRFFGTSGSHSVNFDLDFQGASGAAAQLIIQMKGASGIHYLDEARYTYNFNISLNGLNVNFPSFRDAERPLRTYDINDTFLRGGSNTISFIYSGTNDETTAHLDFFSIIYPRALSAANKYLAFYTEENLQNAEYRLSAFNDDDIYLLDVTDPVNPHMLLQDVTASGNLSITIPAGSREKKLVAFDLSSSQIESINNLQVYRPRNYLLDINKSADFIIITRNSLLSYAYEIAELRDHLKTEVASIEDINLYFNSGVDDPTAIRNFLRYAYYNWQNPSVSYVLLFGDGHYDYRNIILTDSMVVPTFQIFSNNEYPGARESDLYFGQIDNPFNNDSLTLLKPSIAMGRIPVENMLDAKRIITKLKDYKLNSIKDGWQTQLVFVADDNITSTGNTEWFHQQHAEAISRKSELARFTITKIYLSAYPSIPGGRRFLKPQATNALIDQINRGTLILNYTGHGSPTQWAHETVFNFERDYSKIINSHRLPFIVAATCDFGLFDDPNRVSFSEALIWKENSGAIGILAATRLVGAFQNNAFVSPFYSNLFPNGGPSVELGQAFLETINALAHSSNINDQKYHLLADPSMRLADGSEKIEVITDFPDTLKALSEVSIKGNVLLDNQVAGNFNGGAVMIVNDAEYEDVDTGGNNKYNLKGPLIFRGEISVEEGNLEGRFIVPKTIRYRDANSGRVTFYAWDENTNITAMGYNKSLRFMGSSSRNQENEGPEMDIYFEDQENFRSGDIIAGNPVLIARLSDESGINITGQLGHKIELRIDEDEIIDVSQSFTYNRDSFTEGFIHYPLTSLSSGDHSLTLLAYDNLNNRTEISVDFSISASSGIILKDVVNYPNPFRNATDFTFQTNVDGADVTVKIYTIAGRLIETLHGYTSIAGYNEIDWSGHDRDGNVLANGVYLYKIILKIDDKTKEKIEKMVVLK